MTPWLVCARNFRNNSIKYAGCYDFWLDSRGIACICGTLLTGPYPGFCFGGFYKRLFRGGVGGYAKKLKKHI